MTPHLGWSHGVRSQCTQFKIVISVVDSHSRRDGYVFHLWILFSDGGDGVLVEDWVEPGHGLLERHVVEGGGEGAGARLPP